MRWMVAAMLGALSVSGCKRDSPPGAQASASASAAAAVPSLQAAPAVSVATKPIGKAWRVASGPRLAILAGQGVGPIRIGATVATIERLMDAPCEEKTDAVCRYVDRAVEFLLKDGATHEIHVHREGRPSAPGGASDRTFGFFNGGFPQGARFGMLPQAAVASLGQPKRVEPVEGVNPNGTTEVHHYEGMRVEYDRIANGNVVLAGVVVVPAQASLAE